MTDKTAELELVMKARDLASRQVGQVSTSLDHVSKRAAFTAGAFGSLGASAIGLVDTGLSKLVGGLFDAVKASADEQVGIARLNASLKANVAGFNGNTDAIEATIAKREELGFSDDSLRASLATLVAKYKDVTKAQEVQAVAMDVARLKGISLKEASALVSKGYDGNAKVLKQLGIELPKTASAQDRLAAIQARAAGQAEEYGKTAAGAQEAFGIAMQDTVEEIGSAAAPVLTSFFTFLRTDALPAIRNIVASVNGWIQQNQPLIQQVRQIAGAVLGTLVARLGDLVRWIGSVISTISSNRDVMNALRTAFTLIGRAAVFVWTTLEKVIGFIADLVAKITSNQAVMAGFRLAFQVVATAIGSVVTMVSNALGALGKLVGFLVDLPGRVTSAVSGLWDGLWTGFRSVLNTIIAGWNGLKFTMPSVDLGPLGHVGGFTIGTPNIPLLAKGGFVPPGGFAIAGERGPELVSGGNSGATVTPLNGVVLQGVSERELVDMIDRKLYFRLRRAGTGL